MDYNRSPTIYFETGEDNKNQDVEGISSPEKSDKDNIHINYESENGTIGDEVKSREQKIASLCRQIKNWTISNASETSLSQLSNITGNNELTEQSSSRTSIVNSLIKTLYNRLYSVHEFLYLLACT